MKAKKAICVEEYKCKKQPARDWVSSLGLYDCDKAILLNPLGLLNDSIINASQQLLKELFPFLPGLQGVELGAIMGFEVEAGEFVQIVHNGKNHWLLISTIGVEHPTVRVYDSMYNSLGSHTQNQIAALLHTDSSSISIEMMNVQVQAGGSDCGPFAIAFATALAFGKNPEDYYFDQDALRPHLIKCFESGKMEFFPYTRASRNVRKVKATANIQVFCSCCMPETSGTKWIQCSQCAEWFHQERCVKVPSVAVRKKNVPWFCPQCQLS